MKTVFFGSSNFSLPILEYLVENTNLLFVVLKTEKNVISDYVKENNIKHVLYDDLNNKKLENTDYIIVASFGRIISSSIVSNFKCINVHAALLPKLRGATPIQTALMKGYKNTGISVIEMNEKMDEGDILAQRGIKISDDINREDLEYKMGLVGGELLVDVLFNIDKIKKKKQENSLASYCYVNDFSREKGRIKWDDTAENIRNKIRAFFPAWTVLDNKSINIKEGSVTNIKGGNPGMILEDSKDLLISCSDFYLKIQSIQKEGGNYMDGIDFKNGIKNTLQFN